MPNITRDVWKILDRDLVLQKVLAMNVINVRALAKYLIKKENLAASIDSVISAIRRYKLKAPPNEETLVTLNLFREAKITTRNNMACVTIKKTHKTKVYLKNLLEKFNLSNDAIRIIKGETNIKLIVDQKNIEKIMIFFQEDVISVKENLSEISINLGYEIENTKGIIAKITNEIMLKGINISEFICSVPEVLVYVKKEDLLKAYETLFSLTN